MLTLIVPIYYEASSLALVRASKRSKKGVAKAPFLLLAAIAEL
jgi:hypothetical protein